MPGFQDIIHLLRTGDLVSAGNANRATRQLQQNIEYLRQLIVASGLGPVFLRDQTLESGAQVGMAVYYNTNNARFERALAGAETDVESGHLKATAASQVWGVVYEKANATLGTLLLFGAVDDLSLAASVDDETPDGIYYLSGTTAGKLKSQAPGVSVAVLRAAGNLVFVQPQLADFLKDHVHQQFDLVALPAGEHLPPAEGQPHEIDDADDLSEGWLPADHEIFEGHAPAGAKFGYNLSVNDRLRDSWPPLPPDSAVLQLVRPTVSSLGGTVPPELVVFDEYGIWWMSDCYGEVPWPTDLDTTSSESGSDSCPMPIEMRLTLWFSQLAFLTDQTVVTSLRSLSPQLRITCVQDGEERLTGDLQAELDLDFEEGSEDTAGFLVLKEVDGTTFNKGPVVEAIRAGGSNVTLTGDLDADGNYQGIVEVAVSTQPSLEVPVQLTRLDGVQEQYVEEIMYLGFPAGRDAQLRCRVKVPDDLSFSTPKLKFYFRIMGRSAGTLPALTLSYRRVPRPTAGLATPVSLPTTDTALALTTTAAVGALQYVEASPAEITVAAGDLVFFSLSRADDDAYAGEVGVLDLTSRLSAGS